MHVFRVTIKHGDLTLSTATAIDSDVERAEDRAIKRALTIAGITFENTYDLKATLMPQQVLEQIPATSLPREIPREFTRESLQLIERLDPEPEQYEPSNNVRNNYYEQPEPSKPTKPNISTKPEPIDLSNQLSQIMVEMERIGWTKPQGKDYIVRTYHKQSRDQLSASEVFEFLHYLQSQPESYTF
jgi:hypothetical protein